MPPTLDRRQRQRNMNPGSGQRKQESYVIMLTEIGFTGVWSVGKSRWCFKKPDMPNCDNAKFSAIRKHKCHLHYWTNKGNENHRRLYIHIGLSNWWIGQNKQESYVIMLTEIDFTRVWSVGKSRWCVKKPDMPNEHPRNTFWRQSFYSICKVSTFGKSSSACRAVIQPCVTRRRMASARARHIAFLVCVLTGGVKFGQSEGIPDSGIPSWAS